MVGSSSQRVSPGPAVTSIHSLVRFCIYYTSYLAKPCSRCKEPSGLRYSHGIKPRRTAIELPAAIPRPLLAHVRAKLCFLSLSVCPWHRMGFDLSSILGSLAQNSCRLVDVLRLAIRCVCCFRWIIQCVVGFLPTHAALQHLVALRFPNQWRSNAAIGPNQKPYDWFNQEHTCCSWCIRCRLKIAVCSHGYNTFAKVLPFSRLAPPPQLNKQSAASDWQAAFNRSGLSQQASSSSKGLPVASHTLSVAMLICTMFVFVTQWSQEWFTVSCVLVV